MDSFKHSLQTFCLKLIRLSFAFTSSTSNKVYPEIPSNFEYYKHEAMEVILNINSIIKIEFYKVLSK